MEEETKKPVEGKQIGIVSNYFDHVEVVAIKLNKSLKVGDKIRIVGGDTDFEQVVESMQIHNKNVKKAKKGDDVGIKVSERTRKGYKVYKI